MTAVRSSAIISLSFALVACGDGGGGIASAPTPLSAASSPIPTETRTPLPPTPAITTGTYDAIAAFGVHGEQTISNNAPAGSVQIAVDAATRSYTLTANVGPLQYPATTLRQLADTPLGYSENNSPAHGFSCAGDAQTCHDQIMAQILQYQMIKATPNSDGTFFRESLQLENVGYIAGPRYLSAGIWGMGNLQTTTAPDGTNTTVAKDGTYGIFVFGQRTQPSDIPATGSARYVVESLIQSALYDKYTDEDGNLIDRDGDTVLAIDFASRFLTGTYDLARTGTLFKIDPLGNYVRDSTGQAIIDGSVSIGVHASGSTTVGNSGAFSLALVGIGSVHANRTDFTPVPDIVRPVTGEITGAFFGPQAAEVGGIWMLPEIRQDGSVTVNTDAFAGLRQAP